MTKSVVIVAFDQMEVLDFAGPYEVLTTCNRVALKAGDVEPFHVQSAGVSHHVVARAGLSFVVDYCLEDLAEADILIVPGGVTNGAEKDERLLAWIRSMSASAEYTVSVCTGVFILAVAGVVTSEKVTTHWEDIEELAERFPTLDVQRDVRWVDEGWLMTSAGISAGIDLTLHLVQKVCSREIAETTARQMDYFWHEQSIAGLPKGDLTSELNFYRSPTENFE